MKILSFLRGMVSVLNIRGSSHNIKFSTSPRKDDYKALASDWRVVESDKWNAMGQSNPVGSKTSPTEIKIPGPRGNRGAMDFELMGL